MERTTKPNDSLSRRTFMAGTAAVVAAPTMAVSPGGAAAAQQTDFMMMARFIRYHQTARSLYMMRDDDGLLLDTINMMLREAERDATDEARHALYEYRITGLNPVPEMNGYL